MLRAERAEKFLVCTPLVIFWGTLVANEVKYCQINVFGGKKAIWVPLPPCRLLVLLALCLTSVLRDKKNILLCTAVINNIL